MLITGGGGALAKEMAIRFGARGAHVWLADISGAAAAAVADEVRAAGGQATGVALDVCDVEAVQALVKRIEAAHNGYVAVLVNNAGIVGGKPIQDTTPAAARRVIEVNTTSHLWTIQAVLPGMKSAGIGHIITIASAGGTAGVSKMVPYCASKWGAYGLAEAVRAELVSTGAEYIKTMVVLPYYIRTPLFQGARGSVYFSWLLPILDASYVACRILEGIDTGAQMIALPRLVYLSPLLRAVLPVSIMDKVASILGISTSMDDFQGTRPLHEHTAAISTGTNATTRAAGTASRAKSAGKARRARLS